MNLGDMLKNLPRAISTIFQSQVEQYLDVPLDVRINGL